MANLKVALLIRVRLADGSRPYCKPVYSANGKIKPLHALVSGNAEHHPEGCYALRYLDGRRLKYDSLGDDPAVALVAKRKKETCLQALADGLTVIESPAARSIRPAREPKPKAKLPLADTADKYLNEVSGAKSHKTYQNYSVALKLFLESCKKQYLEDVERQDILAYMLHLRAKRNAPRTVANRITQLKTFFLVRKVAWPLLKSDRPTYTEKVVSAYNAEEIHGLMAAANREEHDLFQFFLCTGAREQEVQYATWRDIDFSERTFSIREKLDLHFTPKDKEEGIIPIPDSLVELLRDRKARHPNSRLIFPRRDGKPDGHLLRRLKLLAFRAGMNCGECYRRSGKCCKTHAVCSRWELHRWRKTFATNLHEAGVPVRTIQRWLRHSNLETTLRYLAGSDDKSQKTRDLVNSTFSEFSADRVHKTQTDYPGCK